MTPSGKRNPVVLGQADWGTIAVYLALVVSGWLNLYAAVHDETSTQVFEFGQRYGMQMIWIGISLVAGLVILLTDDKYYHMLAYPVYGFMLLLMLSTLVFSPMIKGARAWLIFGPVAIQPAEFMKFAVSLALARYMSGYTFSIHSFKNLLRIGLIIGLPIAVMFFQHDIGSAVVYASFIFMLYREGLNRWFYIVLGMVLMLFLGSFWITRTGLLILILIGCTVGFALKYGAWKAAVIYLAAVALVSTLAYYSFILLSDWGITYFYVLLGVSLLSLPVVGIAAYGRRMRGFGVYIALFVSSLVIVSVADAVFDYLDLHQQKRILDTLGIESDQQGWGYNVNQSKIAIGSGGLFGKGFLHGTQTKFNFVPEQSTDFIFCTVGEEWGFAGSIVVISLFCLLILRLIRIGERQQEPFRRIYCYCVAGIFLIHVLINVGMTIGLMPVIGIPLPFFSYGGSSFLAFSLLLFVALRLDMGSSAEIPSGRRNII